MEPSMHTPITIQAVFRNGSLQPIKKLDLPDNTAVQVLVIPLNAQGKPSLFGVIPNLATIGNDIVGIKQLLNDGVDKQMRLMSGGV
jgi:predicted DNA-binding antitoxin AbrB/MazE fold protein